MRRALGSFGLVHFPNWPDASRSRPPQASVSEQLQTMAVIEGMVEPIGQRSAYVDNAIWLLCSRSGLGMSNSSLAAMSLAPWRRRRTGSRQHGFGSTSIRPRARTQMGSLVSEMFCHSCVIFPGTARLGPFSAELGSRAKGRQ